MAALEFQGLLEERAAHQSTPQGSRDLPPEPTLSSPCGPHGPWPAASRGPWRRLFLSGTCWRMEEHEAQSCPATYPAGPKALPLRNFAPGAIASDLLVTNDLKFQLGQ